MNTEHKISLDIARKVIEIVDAGLVKGKGIQEPGKMCVEAAVCFAFGLPHSDNPPCVGTTVREFKIRLNDSNWSNNAARTAGLRKLAIAQLGSDTIDQDEFALRLSEQCIRQIVPIALRATGKLNPEFAARLETAAVRCEQGGPYEASIQARDVARKAAYAAYAAARDHVLNIVAEIGLQVLIDLKSPGCKYLHLCY